MFEPRTREQELDWLVENWRRLNEKMAPSPSEWLRSRTTMRQERVGEGSQNIARGDRTSLRCKPCLRQAQG